MTNTVEIRGRDGQWKVYYPSEERLATPFHVYDKEGNYKETIKAGSDTQGMTEAHFVGPENEAIEYAKYLLPGCEVTVTRTMSPSERMKKAREAKKL
jgi:hypothetical protein